MGMMVPLTPILLSSSRSWEKLEPLWRASKRADKEVVQLLLALEDVNPDKPDNKDIAPHRSTSSNGHEWVVRLRREPDDVNPEKPDNKAKTPL